MISGCELVVEGSEEDGYDVNVDKILEVNESEINGLVCCYIGVIGGLDNLIGIDVCIICLCLNVKDFVLVNDGVVKCLGVFGVICLNK